MKKTVVIGFLGSTLDNTGWNAQRWERWRPTISLCQHENLLIHRLELLYQKKYHRLFNTVCADIKTVSPETEIVPHEISLENPWDFEEVFSLLHDFATHYQFHQQEDYLIHITTGTHVAQICLFLLTEARYFPAQLLQSGPGRERSSRPEGTYSIIDLDLSRYDSIATRFHKDWQDDISFLKSGIETRNSTFNSLIEKIEKVAARSIEPMLLTGPTGAGKSHLARRIFQLKKLRKKINGNFVEINCATLRGDNAMSALFGHTRGSFTGAINRRDGLLKKADRGLLFLDEIGELGLDEQAMLLQAIEEKTFLPVGSDIEETSDFQLICGTNKNLVAESHRGNFRQDLLARINLWTFQIPGLKERPEDIEPNLNYELQRYSSKTGNKVTINTEAKRLFLDFAISPQALWQANFRDLSGAVSRMATLASRGRITSTDVREEILTLQKSWSPSGSRTSSTLLPELLGQELYSQLDLFDQIQLSKVIEICKKSATISEAGRILFDKSRHRKKSTNDSDRLRKYLAKFNLHWDEIQKETRIQQSTKGNQ